MGQTSSFHLSITDVAKDWMQMATDSPIFINRITRQQLQRFILQIPLPELLREVTIYNARIQAVYPSVCRVAYFNQMPSEYERPGFHCFAVYTDHLLPIRQGQWTPTRFVHALQAVITLTSYYGYFKLAESMVRVNERGEVKVWISEAPANNHRDCVLASEEQALAAFAGLAARKNYQVANQLIGCISLQQALERLTRPKQKSGFPSQNLTQDREMRRDYKNVFNQMKGDMRSLDSNGQSALLSGRKEELKPYSYGGGKKQNVKTGRTTSQYKKKPSGEFFLKRRPQSKQVEETSFDNFSKTGKQPPSFDPLPHFPTEGEFSSNFQIPSPTNKSQQSKPQVFTPDITIINNNVSHVVNNITHNHSSWNHFRNLRTPEFMGDHKKEAASPPGRKEKVSAPKFIQQRRQEAQSKHNIKSFYGNNSQKSSGIINAPKSFLREPPNFSSTHTSNNTDTQESFKAAEMEWSMPLQQRKPQKLYTFSRPINSKSPPKFSTSFSPHSHTPLTPTSAQTQPNSNPPSYFKRPNRTQTTDFNDAHNKNSSINVNTAQPDNKSFTLQKPEIRRTGRDKTVFSQPIAEEMAQSLPTSKSIAFNSATSNKTIDQGSLKSQLRLEFSNLLGNEPKMEKKQTSGQDTPPESHLKEKIQQKKMAFAELKKEALAVLTDII